MPLITRYICRRILVLFPAGLLTLTGLIWSTQALQRLDLVTAKGQTFGVFLKLTGLAIPYLATLLAPVALVIAIIVVFGALNRDSELVVIAASGGSRWRILAPVLWASGVCAMLVTAGTVWAGPAGLASARVILTEVRADVITSIVRPGRFIEVDDGLTVHIGDRQANGTLTDLLLDDKRASDRSMTYLAQTGRVTETGGNTLLLMTNGSVQRMERPSGELSVVAFDAYAFDLTALTAGPATADLRASERTLAELVSLTADPATDAESRAQFRVEIHDRLSQPLAVFVYALIVFVFVGDPRTHRQNRLVDVVAAAVSVAALKGSTFAVLLAAGTVPQVAYGTYVLLAAAAGLSLTIIASGRSVTAHEAAARSLSTVAKRLLPAGPRRAVAP